MFLQTSPSRLVSATAGRHLGDTVKAAQRHNLDKKKTKRRQASIFRSVSKLACQGRKRSAFAQPSRNAGDGLRWRPSPQTPQTERSPITANLQDALLARVKGALNNEVIRNKNCRFLRKVSTLFAACCKADQDRRWRGWTRVSGVSPTGGKHYRGKINCRNFPNTGALSSRQSLKTKPKPANQSCTLDVM